MTVYDKARWEQLIPELTLWHDKGMNVESWLACLTRYDHFVGYAQILWPAFLEHDGCIFLAEGFSPKGYKEWRSRLSKRETEAMINHRHITDLFLNSEFKANREIVIHIGKLLKETWQAKLDREFPGRHITVSFPEDFSEDLVDYEISFFQEKHP